MPDLVKQLKAACPDLDIRENVSLAPYTTMRVGGAAQYFAEPSGTEEIIELVHQAQAFDMPVLVLGKGSNLIVRDGGVPGLTVHIGSRFAAVGLTSHQVIKAQAGVLLSQLSHFAHQHALSGLEFAAGIPGSLGGAIFMNAGAYGGEMSQVITRVWSLTDDGVVERKADQLSFTYRHSAFMEDNQIILEAEVQLPEGDPERIGAAMAELNERRREKQPLNYPSAGSFFKRPAGHFAGQLIEACGLKGCSVGGAKISEKHAGFMINVGGATASDILALMALVQEKVMSMTGVMLEPEPRIVGVD